MAVSISLADRVALVTGAVGGVGAAVARLFAEAGAAVVLSDLDRDRVGSVAAGLAEPGRHHAIAADIGEEAGCRELAAAALDRFGRVDILVNVAARLKRVAILEVDTAEYQRTMDVNLRSQLLLCQALIPGMVGRGRGAVINFTSPSAFTGGKFDAAHYAMSKSGTISLSRALATQFGGKGVRTNVLCPGTTDTPMIRDTLSPDQVRAHVANVPLGRLADPAEIAAGALFLASDLASFVNGTVLTVDGGASMRP